MGQKFGHLHDSISSAGYPTNAYRGEKLVYTEGRKGLEETGFVNVPSNAMAEGCSGGAWLIKESGGHFAVGVNSHSRPGVPGMFSPKLNSMTVTLFNTAVSKVGGDRVENNGDHTDTEQSDDDEHEQNEGRHPPHVEPINPSTNHNQKCNVRACERKCGLNFQWQCINGREVCRCL